MKTIALLFVAVPLLLLVNRSPGASVTGNGYVNDFSSQPLAADWTTTSAGGSASDTYDMDLDINANVMASGVTTPLPADPGSPPEANALATWSSTGQFLQTRPTGVRYTVLLGTFVNQTETNATQIAIAYDLTIAMGGIAEELGTRVYYSLSGLTNSWINIPALNTTSSTDGTTSLSATVALEWTNGASLYIAWLDDNASGFGTDGAHEIDNFSLRVTAGLPVSTALLCTLTAPTNNAVLISTASITAAAGILRGTAPYNVQFFTNRGVDNPVFGLAGASATAPYNVSLGRLAAGTYNLYAVATDSAGTPETSVSLTNTFRVLDPLMVALAEPVDQATFDHTAIIPGTATVTGGTPPYAAQFYLDDLPSGALVVTEPYTQTFGPLFVGDHTLRVVVMDGRGWISNSVTHTIRITGPLAAIFTPTNGITYNFGQTVTLSALLGGGTAPYTARFYANDQLVGVLSAPPFATNLGVLAAGSYACYLHATDSSSPTAEQFDSSTNVITILPNPLVATLTSPGNGQNAATNSGFTMAVSASVAAPLSVTGVEFFVDGVSAGADATSPYSIRQTSLSLGSHSVYAVATDSLGRQVFTATNLVNGIYDPLANDLFANRITLTGPVAGATASNVGAGTEGGEPTGGGFGGFGATLWWTWTAPISSTVRLDTFGSSFNTSLGVYTGNAVNGLRQTAFNDNAPGSADVSLVTFNAQQGTTYQIQVGGVRTFSFPQQLPPATGTIKLNLLMPPAVAITAPVNGATFTAGSNFLVTATAGSPHGPITKVDFYAGSTSLGSVTNPPYTVLATGVLPGTNRLVAVATDALGLVATSAVVNVAVFNVGVTVVSPADGATFANTNPITLRAVTWQTAGTVTNVEFLVDGEPVGQDTNAPFSVVWSAPTPGLHRLTARAADDAGNSYLSTIAWIAIAQPILPLGSVWKYLDNGSDQGTAWQAPAFDDSAWRSGPAELGYGDGDEATVVEDNATPGYNAADTDRYLTTYFRRAFVVSNVTALTSLTLALVRDDAGVVYLNGRELFRSNLPAAPAAITFTNRALNSIEETTDTITLSATNLIEGTNVLAVEIHQDATNSSDISFDLSLSSLPEIIRNQLPPVNFIHVANHDFFFAPAHIILDAAASDTDGYVTNIAIYAGSDKVAESTQSPCPYQVSGLEPGIYEFTAVALDNGGARGVTTVRLTVYEPTRKWIAFNDHYAGTNTHRNATAWNAFGTAGGAPGEEGALRDIATGAALPAYLSVFAFGVMGDRVAGAPPAGTPAYDIFHGYVDFGSGGVNHAIVLGRDSLVFHVFSGLDPTRRYSFRATAVGGVPDFRNRWTLFTLLSADEATPAHSANVLTSATAPESLGPNEVAMNTGDNLSGDVVGWDAIDPGADGAITLVSTLYLGAAPGNTPPGPYAYAPVALRLEETGTRPYVVLTQPTILDYDGFTDLPIAATASAVEGVTNVLFLANGKLVGADATPPFSVIWSNADFGFLNLVAVAIDGLGVSSTSAAVSLTIDPPPQNIDPPVVAAVSPPDGAIVASLTSLVVTFSEEVYGVQAGDLLINGTPATALSGSGSNYVFTITQPAYGNVQMSWAAAHGITDKGYPASLPFNATGPGARWYYTLTDRVGPTVLSLDPPASANVSNLNQITITFSEPVNGVDAADLIVRGLPATGVSGAGAIYTFTFPMTPYGPVVARWATAHGIVDRAPVPNAFVAGGTWSYVISPNAVLVATNSLWRAWKGTQEASTPLSAWRDPAFDDTNWATVSTPVFFGAPYEYLGNPGTLLPDMSGHYSSVYLRKTFTVTRVAWLTNMLLRAQSDDGFIAWINGVEVYRFNVPLGEPTFDGTAMTEFAETASGVSALQYTLPDPYTYLREGSNVLAVQAFNYAATNDDFMFDTQLATYRYNPTLVGPGLVRVSPPAGSVLTLTNLTVLFNEPVGGVQAEDLLVNGLPATAVSGGTSNETYTFSFPQPIYGVVAITWASGHGIADFDATPRSFNANGAGSTWQYALLNPRAPLVVGREPEAEHLLTELTQLRVTFSEAVQGVSADDLLVNGVPATGLSGEGSTYTFSFVQPAYGVVAIAWSPTQNITDTEFPPVPFNTAAPGSTWKYTLIDRTSPAVAARVPAPGPVEANLTDLTVTFTEPVLGVDAADLLINGVPATGVNGSGAVYSFNFTQPNATEVTITWAIGHGIHDTAFPANPFNAAAPGATWSYQTRDNVPPTLVGLTPPADSTLRLLSRISLTFDEAVTAVTAGDLQVNGVAALAVAGAGAGPYTFTVGQPDASTVQVALGGAIRDLAVPPNAFAGATWTYLLDTNLPPPLITRGPYLQSGTPTGGIVRWRTDVSSDAMVYYGATLGHLTNFALQSAVSTEHIVALSGLLPDTQYYYAIGNSAEVLAGGTEAGTNYWFKTSPVPGTRRPLRIWALGDSGTAGYGAAGALNQANVREAFYRFAATNGQPDLWLMLGDNAYPAGTDAEHQLALFDMYPATLRNLFLWPTIGNHETDQSFTATDFPYLDIFSLPQNGEAGGVPSGTEKYYSFDYANIHFVCLDSMTSTRTSTSPMAEWLQSDLGATAQEWVIVFFHHPPYTKGNHDSDRETELIDIRQNINPILETNGVDLVLCGHSHALERSFLLNGHYGLSGTLLPAMKIDGGGGREDGSGAYRKNAQGQGVIYMVGGSSGQITGGSLNHPAHFISLNQLGSTILDVNGGRLDVKFLGTNGAYLDHYTLLKAGSEAPAAPLNVVAHVQGTNQVTLVWDDVATNELGYLIQRSLDGTNFIDIATNGANTTAAVDADLLANQVYYYRVRAFNEMGPSAITPSVQAFTGNTAPALEAIDDAVVDVLGSLVFFAKATDADWPSNQLTYSLQAGAPANAFLETTNGWFYWQPSRDQAGTTNVMTVQVMDDGDPPLGSTQTFTAVVREYLEMQLGSVVMRAVERTNVTIDMVARVALTNVTCVLPVPPERLTELALENLVPTLATATLDVSASNVAALGFAALPGQTLVGTQQLARLHFTAVEGQVSAFVPLGFSNVVPWRAEPGLSPSVILNAGRVTVVGNESLLEAAASPSNAARWLMVYGPPGSTYMVEHSQNPADASSWQPWRALTLTNLWEPLDLGPATNPPAIFYRTRE